jgi:hypothetical protein
MMRVDDDDDDSNTISIRSIASISNYEPRYDDAR